jgi:circadian clock protein KaiC
VKQSQSFGWEITEPVEQGFIRYASYPADSFNLDQHLLQVQNLLEAQKPDRAVVDSLSSLSEVLTHEEVIKYVKTVQSYLKAQGVTSLFITSSETGDVTPNGEISTLVDNIVSFQQFEIDSALKRSLVVFKARGTQHDTDIREFEITSKGISVKGKFAGVEQILGGAARKTVLTQIRRRP